MNNIEKKRLLVKDIKTMYHQRTNSNEFLVALSKFTKIIFPIDRTVVHAGTGQIIAHGQHYDAAVLNGDEYIEVALADFPEKYLIHAVATHWEPPTETVKLKPFIPVFMKYYAKENGEGAEFREDAEDKSLREFVAGVLNTNKTYLDWIEGDKATCTLVEQPAIFCDRPEICSTERCDIDALTFKISYSAGDQCPSPNELHNPVPHENTDNRSVVANFITIELF